MAASAHDAGSSSPDFALSDFQQHLVNYLVVLSCKYIGDDVAYIRYMQKQAACHNEHAIAGISALDFVDKIHRAVDRNLQFFAATGHTRIVRVCNAIRGLDQPPSSHSKLWHVCALSGVHTNHALLLPSADSTPLAIDSQFTPFASMLWLITHIDAVEYNRTMQFVNSTPGRVHCRFLVAPAATCH